METERPSDMPLIERLQLWDDALSKPSWNVLALVILHRPRHETQDYEEMLRRWSPRLDAQGKLLVK